MTKVQGLVFNPACLTPSHATAHVLPGGAHLRVSLYPALVSESLVEVIWAEVEPLFDGYAVRVAARRRSLRAAATELRHNNARIRILALSPFLYQGCLNVVRDTASHGRGLE